MTRLIAKPYPAYIRPTVRSSGTKIPLAADKAQEDETILMYGLFRPYQ